MLSLDRRLLPGDDPEKAVAEIQEAIGSLSELSVKVEMGNFLYPSEVSSDCSTVKDLSYAIRTMLEREPELEYSHAAYDAGYLNLKGIQTVRYGAGNDHFPAQFHHADTDIASVNDEIDVTKALSFLALDDVSSKPTASE